MKHWKTQPNLQTFAMHDGSKSCDVKKKVQRNLHFAMAMAEEGVKMQSCADKATANTEKFAPDCNKHHSEMRKTLLHSVVRGETSEKSSPLVMVLDICNYTGCLVKGALVFQCSLCNYIGDRYYHAGRHFERIHIRKGRPMHRKRKYVDVVGGDDDDWSANKEKSKCKSASHNKGATTTTTTATGMEVSKQTAPLCTGICASRSRLLQETSKKMCRMTPEGFSSCGEFCDKSPPERNTARQKEYYSRTSDSDSDEEWVLARSSNSKKAKPKNAKSRQKSEVAKENASGMRSSSVDAVQNSFWTNKCVPNACLKGLTGGTEHNDDPSSERSRPPMEKEDVFPASLQDSFWGAPEAEDASQRSSSFVANCAFCYGWNGVQRCPFHCKEESAKMAFVGDLRKAAKSTWNEIVEQHGKVHQVVDGEVEGGADPEWTSWFLEGSNLDQEF